MLTRAALERSGYDPRPVRPGVPIDGRALRGRRSPPDEAVGSEEWVVCLARRPGVRCIVLPGACDEACAS